MANKFETWSIGNGEVFLYTEDALIAKEVREIYGSPTLYKRNRKVFAWQFRVPKKQLSFLEKKISKNLSLEIQ